ncbi:MAG TPA: hypothetical protein VK473_10320 [Terriglobales bacterium]|nr:hypothetical protein [Terriglobales bacterium]
MTAEEAKRRVRLNPAKFWSATRSMTPQEKESLLTSMDRMAEESDLHGLNQFDFVSVDEPASGTRPSRRSPADREHEWEPGSDGHH